MNQDGVEVEKLDVVRESETAVEMFNLSKDERPAPPHVFTAREPSAQLIEDVARTRAVLRKFAKAAPFLLSPTSMYMKYFDVASSFALVFTALVTPAEVAFLPGTNSGPLFWCNRGVDLVFIADMVQTFCLPYYDQLDGNRLVREHRKIVTHYLLGWFPLDFISLFPFGLLGQLARSSSLEALQGIRVIRLLRLMKLTRLARLGRIATLFERWEMEIAVPYAKVALCKYLLTVLLTIHWCSCAWGLAAETQLAESDDDDTGGDERTPAWTWLAALEAAKTNELSHPAMRFDTPSSKYLASLYFSLYTITSVGYGDIAPQTLVEYVTCMCMILSGALVWAWTIGSFCAVLSSMDQDGMVQRQTLDDLNFFMEENRLSADLRARLRRYTFMCKTLRRTEQQKLLLAGMSPTLNHEVVEAIYRGWFSQVWYLSQPGISDDFIRELAFILVAHVFAPLEVVEQHDSLFIITRGLAMRNGIILRKGDVWNEDFLVPFISHEEACKFGMLITSALSYIEVRGVASRVASRFTVTVITHESRVSLARLLSSRQK